MVCSGLISVNKLIKHRNNFLPVFRKAASTSLYATSLNTETKVTKRFLPRYSTLYVNRNGIFSLTTQSRSKCNIFLKPSMCPSYVEAKLFHSLITSAMSKQENVKKKSKIITRTKRMCTTRADTKAQISAENDVDTISANFSSSKLKLSSQQIKQILFEDGEDMKNVQKQFSAPKNILHNIFHILSEETKTSMHISPNYKIIKDEKNKSLWLCTYHIKWPTEVKFLGWHSTKKVAAHRAALAALCWLRNENKLTEKGMPIVYDKEHQRQLSKRTIPSMVLSNKVLEKMNKIVALHQNEIMPHINMNKEITDDNSTTQEDVEVSSKAESLKSKVKNNQQFLDLGRYLAKEKITLPIAAYKEQFLDILRNNRIVIIQGEPGCGKSTRIPQYVLEGWAKEDGLLGYPGKIAVTQPRRIAAISLAERVSSERNEIVGHIVGYQVRLNSRFRNDTGRILYCTTGILLRHLQSDLSLSEFSHIILDEAHERDVNTDLLMNLIKQALELNPRLKLVIMSATINANMFSEYYGGAPVLKIPGFTYPVNQYFLENYPIDVSKTLKMTEGEPNVVHEDIVKVIEFIHKTKPEGAILCFLPGWEDIRKIEKTIPRQSDLAVYCLHSRLQDSDQWKIFSRPPPGVRKIILATNIAETSVTIDDVVYVVDTGMHKEQRFDIGKGLICIDCHWISKSSVIQRKGRAGRVQAGECFHLYPISKYESFPEYSLPEIVRTSLTKIVLDCKVFSNNMNALEFMGKLPTPPEEEATKRAVKELIGLELLDNEEKLTSLGRTLAEFQLEPKLSKAMVNAVIFGCVTPIIDIITLFSAETELFVTGLLNKEDVRRIKMKFCNSSDHLAMMKIFEKWLELKANFDSLALKKFCDETSLVPRKMELIEKLRRIHFDYIYDGLYDVLPISDEYSDNDELIKAVLFSGVGNVLQRRNWDIVKNRLKNNVNVFLTRYNHKASISNESVNHKRWKFPTSLLMYINETRSNIKRISSIRECSLIPEISVLLFSNNNLIIQEVNEETVNATEINDQVKLVLENTNVQLICDRMQASIIIQCKGALMAGYRYYIKNLTDFGEHNPELNNSWNKIVRLLNDILNEHGIRT